MSSRRFSPVQPTDVYLSPEAQAEILAWTKKYPTGRQRSALIPALWIAQKDAGGWLPEMILREVGDRLGMAYIRVYEVATFYTMFNLAPVGKYHIQLCGTTPCWLRGSDALKDVLARRVGPQNTIGADGTFSWIEVECLGACANAPMMQVSADIDDDPYYEDLTPDTLEAILDDLAAGREPARGPQIDRINSAPEGGPKTLNSKDLYAAAQKLSQLPHQDKKVAIKRHADDPKGVRATIAGRRNKPKSPPKTRVDHERSPAGELLDKAKDMAKAVVPDNRGTPVTDRKPVKADGKPTPDPKGAAVAPRRRTSGAVPEVLYREGPTDGQADDLKKIKGIGPVLERELNEGGIYYYRQIGAWKVADIKTVEREALGRHPGRIKREGWVKQAKALAKKAET
ncbi:NADH-quinone oxidoreductase subunit NuoE [uncultured Algimonas sp.]|uniref:NADH-quinone oxidoreductase subunit NuoE n=1 Tax=uncultured Algimonas sp. TaxID=1547920 RepID=UPI00261AFE4A|nr:NADH-quinone oxidoreductase subunit NuoE [uncultured Algimonas sp.]